MALEKKDKLPNGFTVNYWKVSGDVRINPDSREANFSMAGYKDEATRRATNAPVITRDVAVRKEEFDQFFNTDENYKTQCYKCAQFKDPFFNDAMMA